MLKKWGENIHTKTDTESTYPGAEFIAEEILTYGV